MTSLDVFRGMTISLMILVNTPGSWSYVYAPLRHASWHGCTPTDLVFPFFLQIVGISLWFSLKKQKSKLSKDIFLKIIKRASIIFLVGLFLNLFPYFNFEKVRVLGVLQRISIAYFIGSILCVIFNKRNLIIITIILLLGYWGLLYLGNPANPYSLENNLAGKIDMFLFGENHIYKGFGIPFDPEGLLASLPAVGTVLIGYLTGGLISNNEEILSKIKKLLFFGISLSLLGILWGEFFPINKPLWTSSYVVYTSGLGMIMLTFLILLVDLKNFGKWLQPFVHFGANPLFIFVFSGLYVKTISYLIVFPNGNEGKKSLYQYLFNDFFAPFFGNMNGSLIFALSHIVFFWGICYLLYRNKIFIKI